MDQMTCAHASQFQLFSLLCQQIPNPPFHNVTLPADLQLFGIDSGVKRSTASNAYQRIRTAAFIGKRLMNLPDDTQHLCQVSLSKYNNEYRILLPEKMSGNCFTTSVHLDPLTKVDPSETYPIRAATSHPIEENFRVQLFEQLLTMNQDTSDHISTLLGELMFQSNAGYTSCDLNSDETQLLVNMVREQTLCNRVLFGAKVTGGGGGGTVAILGQNSSRTVETINQIIEKYEKITGRRTRIFSGSSSGLTVYPPITLNA